ncbi:protein containing PilT protein [Candidatus Magnetomorum sp. HK-1]|nr:protein containing PilT protein [Candidatus Magnetomorum sp. HK-1]
MKPIIFFDTSAIIKLYHDEDGTDDVLSIINSYDPSILISDLTKIEFVSAFAKKVRTNEITEDICMKTIRLFEIDTKKFEIIEIDKDIKLLAIELLEHIAIKRGLKTLDSLQLASALAFTNKHKLKLFVSSDKVLGQIAEEKRLNALIV